MNLIPGRARDINPRHAFADSLSQIAISSHWLNEYEIG